MVLGYIDLSKRRVGQEDIVKCTEKFSNAKHVRIISQSVTLPLTIHLLFNLYLILERGYYYIVLKVWVKAGLAGHSLVTVTNQP